MSNTYPPGITSAHHIAHDMRMGRFPQQSSVAEFLAEELEQARKALEPFSELADEGNDDQPDKTRVIVQAGRSTVYTLWLSDLRRARDVYRAIMAMGDHADEHEANAKLIAAAPDMYQALSSIANTYDKSWSVGSQERRIGDLARSVLAKAEGRTP